MRIIVLLTVFFAGLTFGAEELNFSLSLKPAKTQIFVGAGRTLVDGDIVADNQYLGLATIHPLGHGFFLRPFIGVVEIDPEKTEDKSFVGLQPGVMLGKKITDRFAALVGGSATCLFPENGEDEVRPTLNAATATTLISGEDGDLLFLTPLSLNEAPNGKGVLIVSGALAWMF